MTSKNNSRSDSNARFTYGQRRAFGGYVVSALMGGILGVFMALKLATDKGFDNALSVGQLWLILASAAGAVLGLYFVRNLFGRAGAIGFLWASLGGLALIFVGGIAGGTIALPGFGTMFGVLLLVSTIVEAPLTVLVIWGAVMIIHLQFRDYVKERNSILNWNKNRR